MNKKDDVEKMKPFRVNFPPSLWFAGRKKAGIRSFAAIIRRLVELWLEGKITLD